jgi:hypothetical protein
MRIALLGAAAGLSALVYLVAAGNAITSCLGLEQVGNDACQAAFRSSLPWWHQLLASPAGAVLLFVFLASLIGIAKRHRA